MASLPEIDQMMFLQRIGDITLSHDALMAVKTVIAARHRQDSADPASERKVNALIAEHGDRRPTVSVKRADGSDEPIMPTDAIAVMAGDVPLARYASRADGGKCLWTREGYEELAQQIDPMPLAAAIFREGR